MDDLFVFYFIILCAFRAYKNVKNLEMPGSKRQWVRELNLNRKTEGLFERIFEKMKTEDEEQFRRMTRMKSELFDLLFSLLECRLKKNSQREAISAKCRLFLTLLYLSQGTSRQVLAMAFRMGISTVRKIILETCDCLWGELSCIYLSPPNKHEWERISKDFENIWNLPNCLGAIDGKHIDIICPPNSGSQFYNYKGTYSIVLLGVCDANYTFTAVDIGAFGSQSDGGVLAHSVFGKALLEGKLDLPEDKLLGCSDISFPHFFVGDAAFPLKPFLMRPYPGRLLDSKQENFNRRLSRARRTIENTFGILTARWRILRSTMNMTPDSAEKVVKAAVLLHNFIKMNDSSYCPPEYTDRYDGEKVIEGLWRTEVQPMRRCRIIASNNASKHAFNLRNILKDYLYENRLR